MREFRPVKLSGLTDRQLQLALAIAHDYSSKEIGFMLGISCKTVESHRDLLYKKIKRNSYVGVARWVIARGWVCLNDELRA